MAEQVECVVIGAGVIGLAVARALALRGLEVVVLEKAEAIGAETSSRNSEVVHAGIHYPKDSLKARHCVRGGEMLYASLGEHGIPHHRCGKYIVATSESQVAELEVVQARATANGVTDLTKVSEAELKEREPALNARAALLSPSTGIVDSHAYMLALQGDVEDRGATIAFLTSVTTIEKTTNGYLVATGGREAMNLKAGIVVNAAGLGAQAVARSIDILNPKKIPPLHFAKGNYFAVRGRVPFSKLIYPVPEQAGLGVHLTLDSAGQGRFGPDVEWVDAIDYRVDPARAEKFYAAIRRYWPDLRDGSLAPAYSGVRPKLRAPGEPAADFVISGPEDHGLAGLVNLFGIESPGLTASLSIAEDAVGRLRHADRFLPFLQSRRAN